jgi:hypothetical protein
VVRKRAENGSYYHEPPYTEEEEDDFYRRVGGGPVSILHRPKTEPSDAPKPEEDLHGHGQDRKRRG